MSPSTRFSLRLFAYFALSFTPLMVLGNWAVAWLIGSVPDPLTIGLGSALAGLLYGVFMTLIVGRAHRRGIAQLGPVTDETLRVHHVRSIRLESTGDAAFDRALCAVRAIGGARVTTADRERGRIEARVSAGRKSWGETITLAVTPVEGPWTELSIESRPWFRFTLADYGKNLGNVLAIVHALREQAPSEQAPGDASLLAGAAR